MSATTGKRDPWLVIAGAYVVLFLLGVVQGLVGSFLYSLAAGPVPVAALVSCAVILATCLLAARGMRSVSGAFVPGAGWILATFVLSMPVSNGSVIIAATAPGKWYLYGGTLCVAAAVAASFGRWVRAGGRPPAADRGNRETLPRG